MAGEEKHRGCFGLFNPGVNSPDGSASFPVHYLDSEPYVSCKKERKIEVNWEKSEHYIFKQEIT